MEKVELSTSETEVATNKICVETPYGTLVEESE